jgi:hypothetical protein
MRRGLSLILGFVTVGAIHAAAQGRNARKNACEDDCYASCMARYGLPRGQTGTPAFDGCYQGCVMEKQCRPAPSRLGGLLPKYQLLTILYAPPGCTSSGPGCGGPSEVSYESGSSSGTRVSAKRSFADNTETSVDAGLSVPGLASLTLSGSNGFSVTASDSTTQTISKSLTTTIRIAGNGDGVNHGQDQFVLLLNPAVAVKVVPPLGGRGAPTRTLWSTGHTGPSAIIYTVYASELRDPSTMRPTVASQLQKLGFTNSDFATILAQDPFAGGASSIDKRRFVRTTWTFPYEPALQQADCPGGVCTCAAFSGVISNDLENEASGELQTQYTVGYSVSGGPTLPTGTTLTSLNIKDEKSFTWTNSASKSATTSASQKASATVMCPSILYTGPTLMEIFWDSLYGSFVFAPLDFAGKLTYQGKLPRGVKRGEVVELSYGGKTYHTVTGRDGAYRFALPATPRGTALSPTAELSIRGSKQVVSVTPPAREFSTRMPLTTDGFSARPSPSATWTRCANEGGTCTFSGTRQVRYGANGRYAVRTITGGTACNTTVFGDPTPGVTKACEILNDTFTPTPRN